MAPHRDLTGIVVPGRGLGAGLMADREITERLQALAGFPVVPGTLNLRLPRPLERDSSWRYVAAADIRPDWEARTGQAGYYLASVTIAGRYRGLAFQADEPEEPGYPADQIELFSEVHLRRALGLADGDQVAVAVLDPGSYFVANVRDLRWQENELGATCEFDKHRERFPEFGINLTVLTPGQPMTMYHRERYQEGFLVLRGECLLIVEGQEVQLRQWDYFHCPPDVAHAIVGAGTGPSLVLAVGNRIGPDDIVYPRDETALKHGAGVERETPHPKEAYARFTRPAPEVPFRDEFLTG
jgi:uncharacterized cupin superfamily protein